MTTAVGADTPGEQVIAVSVPRPRSTRAGGVVALRWAIVLLSVIVAFFPTWTRLAEEAADGAITAYIFVLPLLAAVAAQGIARRRSGELPIHDRQSDVIVGGLAILVAAAIKGLWLPRYVEQYELLHLDVLAAVVFVLGASILVFGLRPVGRFWPVWLLLSALSPLLYRMAAIGLGGSRFAYAAVLVVLAGAAGAIAVGRTRRRGWCGFFCTIATGSAVLAVLLVWWPDMHIAWLQLLSAVGASAVTGAAFFIFSRRGRVGWTGRTLSPMTAKRSISALMVVVFTATAILFIPLPARTADISVVGPPGTGTEGLLLPSGWSQRDFQRFDWAKTYFGRSAVLTRQTVRAETGDPLYDSESRPRRLVVDVLDTANRASLAVYPESTLYQLSNTRTSRALPVDLGHGVSGVLYTSVSDALLLTWTKLVFLWVRGDLTQRVTVISVDNHEPGAVFPVPTPSMASNLASTLATFLRGNAIAVDNDPDYKDRALLTSFARDLVATQWSTDHGQR
jgi:hypothetical protein